MEWHNGAIKLQPGLDVECDRGSGIGLSWLRTSHKHNIVPATIACHPIEQNLAIGRIRTIAYRFEFTANCIRAHQIGRNAEAHATGNTARQPDAQRANILKDQNKFAKWRIEEQRMWVRCEGEW